MATTPDDLARQLGWTGKDVRDWLRDARSRDHPLTRDHVKGQRYTFGDDEGARLLREMFASGRRRTPAGWDGATAASPAARPTSPQPAPYVAPPSRPVETTSRMRKGAAGPPQAGAIAPAASTLTPGNDTVITELCTRPPVPAAEALLTATFGAGIYAWWSAPKTLADVSHAASGPTVNDDWELLYVGLTGQTVGLHDRLAQHLGNRTGSSTLRRAFGAWLWQQQRWQPALSGRTKPRPAFTPASEQALTAWMIHHLRVTTASHARPGDVEEDIIKQLAPPLNYQYNRAHPNWAELDRRRSQWRAAAHAHGPAAGS